MTGLFSRPAPVIQAAPLAPSAAPPIVSPPATMPDTSSSAVTEANRRAQMDIINRAGRSSTILTNPSQRGSSRQNYDSYASRTLGAGG